MKNTHQNLIFALAFAAAVASPASGQDWPQWRGINRDSKAAGFNAPKTWPKEFGSKWKVEIGEGVATPALVGDKLYVLSRQEGNEITRCLDAATGKELWQDRYDSLGATGPASGFSGPRSTPTVADGKVITQGVRGVLSCLDAATGKKLWRKDDFAGAWPRFFVSSSPIVADGLCIAELGGQGKGGVVAYDLNSGDQKWKWDGADGPSYASPVLMTFGGEKVIISQTEKQLVALRVKDGKQLWETPFAPAGRGYNASTPLVDGQTLIYAGQGRGIKAVQMSEDGDAINTKESWSNPDLSPQFNSPVLKDGFIYGITQDNQFFCLSAKDGKTAWTAPVSQGGGGGGRGSRGGYGSVVDGGSVLLALTPASELVVIQPNGKEYTEVARIKVAETPTYASVVPSGNRLFIKDQNSLTLLMVN